MGKKKYPDVTVCILPLTEPPPLVMDMLVFFLEEECGVTAVKMPKAEPVPEACLIGEFSYSAKDLINYVAGKLPKENSRILILADRNIFCGLFNSPAVGVSETGLPGYRSVSVVSLGWAAYGLESDSCGFQKFFSRIIKITAHELGHAFGLNHCKNRCCALYSGDKTSIDERFSSYCPRCQKKIEQHLRLSEERANWKTLSSGKKIKWQLRLSWIVFKRLLPWP